MKHNRGKKHSARPHSTKKSVSGRGAKKHTAKKTDIIKQNKTSKIRTDADTSLIVGTFFGTDKGYGFVASESYSGSDLFVAPKNIGSAMHGDRVRVRITVKETADRKAECEVVEVISRASTIIAGRFRSRKSHGEVEPVDTRLPILYVTHKQSMGAKNGEMVAVRIKTYPERGVAFTGEVIKRLGPASSKRAIYDSILVTHGIRTEFPRLVRIAADNIPSKITPAELEGRLDLRERHTFTIDGAYAKDFDDAVSIEITPDGTYRLGVHIADVSHYVRTHSPLDEEAYERGTSIYFTDKVIPMLPERLSNGICSLVPNEDRLTMSCIMEFDKSGTCIDYEISESVIRSCERLIYSDVSKILDDTDADELKVRYAHILDELYAMRELKEILSKKRARRGSLDFDIPEPMIVLDEEGNPESIVPRERGTADLLIEEFMLAANETVARHLRTREVPAVYRIHESPSIDKSATFLSLLTLFGIPLPKDNKLSNSYLKGVQAAVAGKSYEPVVMTAMLRSMMKAQYSHEPMGHFGLSLDDYCHFTSPIRRYPDICVHRALKADMYGFASERKRNIRDVKEAAVQSTATEMRAVECERDIDSLYKAIYMKPHIGEIFEGMISSVTNAGIFVELPNTVRGLVSMTDLNDDYYIYDDKNLRLFGKHLGKTYTIGDIIRVKLTHVDIQRRMIDFSPA